MVKKLLILCVGFGLAMGLVACQDKNKKDATEPAAQGSDTVTVETMTVTPDNSGNAQQPAAPAEPAAPAQPAAPAEPAAPAADANKPADNNAPAANPAPAQ